MNYKTHIILFFLNIFNTLSLYYDKSSRYILEIYKHLRNLFYNKQYIWHFLHLNKTPINSLFITNNEELHVDWIYNSKINKLEQVSLHNVQLNIPWLSASITDNVNNKEYNIDNFIESFILFSNKSIYIEHILYCWSIYTGIWFNDIKKIKINIIDDFANEINLTYNSILYVDKYNTVRVKSC